MTWKNCPDRRFTQKHAGRNRLQTDERAIAKVAFLLFAREIGQNAHKPVRKEAKGIERNLNENQKDTNKYNPTPANGRNAIKETSKINPTRDKDIGKRRNTNWDMRDPEKHTGQ